MARGAFPARARQSVVYEVRIYSIVGSSCGEVVWAKRIRAAHCLTSLQFSPTSEHILLAYGRLVLSLITSLWTWVQYCNPIGIWLGLRFMRCSFLAAFCVICKRRSAMCGFERHASRNQSSPLDSMQELCSLGTAHW